jgi:TRAP-type C4-dicarboxylate transport system substrate-binding protein
MTGNLVNMIDYQTSYAFWQKLNEKEKDVFKRAIRSASIKTKMEVDRRLDAVKKELEGKGIKFIDTDTSGFKKAIVDNIDTILEGNKDAIKTYQIIVSGEY